MKINFKVTPLFQANTITLPLAEPIILKGTREDKNYAFIFIDNNEKYYIFATLQHGVINNNLPYYLHPRIKGLLIDSVNQYCENSRQGLPDNLFVLKKNALYFRTDNINSNTTSSECI